MQMISPALSWLGIPTPRSRRAAPAVPARPVAERRVAARWRRGQARTARRARLLSFTTRARQPLLTVGGFGALDTAAWSLHPTAGWASIGASLLILEWLSRPDEPRK